MLAFKRMQSASFDCTSCLSPSISMCHVTVLYIKQEPATLQSINQSRNQQRCNQSINSANIITFVPEDKVAVQTLQLHSHLSPCKCSHGQDFAITHCHLSPCKCSRGLLHTLTFLLVSVLMDKTLQSHSHLSPCRCSHGQDFAISHSHLSPCKCSRGQLHTLTFLLVSVLVDNCTLSPFSL